MVTNDNSSPSGSPTSVASVIVVETLSSPSVNLNSRFCEPIVGALLAMIVTVPTVTVASASFTTTVALHVPDASSAKTPPRKTTSVDPLISVPTRSVSVRPVLKTATGSVANKPAGPLTPSNATVSVVSSSGSYKSSATNSSGTSLPGAATCVKSATCVHIGGRLG